MLRDERIEPAVGVVSMTRPWIVLGSLDDARTDRVELDVSTAGEQVSIGADHHGAIPAFPKCAASPPANVDGSHESPPNRLHHSGRSAFILRRDQEVDVIGHQDIRMKGTLEAPTGVEEELAVQPVVLR
jgi:hypothetical protein